MAATSRIGGPPLPLGERVLLPGRGTTFVREVAGPPGATTVVLLHGWVASGGLNWFTAFEPLGRRYRVLAPDLRGHGRGLRARGRFRLADCADDVAALLRQRATGPVIVVGYSMGGPVAQLLWHRHPDLVAGMVLCATSDQFLIGDREKIVFATVMAAAVGTTRTGRLLGRAPFLPSWTRSLAIGGARPTQLRTWAAAEMRRHDLVSLMEAGQAIGSYSARRWLRFVDVPTAVLVTEQDRAVRPEEQLRMAESIPGATVHRIDDGHVACVRPAFGLVLRQAVDDVAARARPSRLAAAT
ncbi:MAG: alpha/beta fold hydrolase [Acidimicrobiia bacterium]|jgi:3-oxoadipate enol-lactonase